MHAGTSRYKPNTPSYDVTDRHGKAGYRIGESKYRGGSSPPFTGITARSVQDVRGFPGLHHLETRIPCQDDGSALICDFSMPCCLNKTSFRKIS